jgi:ABC-type multidrug transport system ATPase subunit
MSIKDVFDEKGGEGRTLLHGSDIPKKVNSVTIVVEGIREAPKSFKSICILDFAKPVHECESWAVNKTNMRALLEKFGLTDEDELNDLSVKMKGKKISLGVAIVNNPQSGKMVRSLFVI